MMKKGKDHTWKHVLLGLLIFLLGFFACKMLMYKKGYAGKNWMYLHLKSGDKPSYVEEKVSYEERLKTVEEKIKLLEEPSTE
ncbi:hypothetical protein ACFL1M_03195 [Patescibacteria group bacterium]